MPTQQSGLVIKPGDFKMQDWLLKTELSGGAKLTYSVLATCTGGQDFVWPSLEYLAERVSYSVRTVQRYLDELISFGLIEKCRKHIKGRVRNAYRFLAHSINEVREKTKTQNVAVQPSKQHDNLSHRSSEPEKILPTDTTICPDRHDKMSPSLNKEETIKGKEYTPPTPQVDPVAQVDGTCEVTGKGGGLFLEFQEEEPEWIEAKKALEGKLRPGSFHTWIAPLLFERNASGVILRCHDQFFLNWVKNHYGQEIQAALKNVGLTECQFDLFTPEQQKADAERKAKTEELQKEAARAAVGAAAPPDEDVDSLPLDEQFKRLYDEYPKHELRKEALKTFNELHLEMNHPKTSVLIAVIKREKKTNQSWQRDNNRYIPQLHNWLTKERWLD